MRLARGLVVLVALVSAGGAALLVQKALRLPSQQMRNSQQDMVDILVAARAMGVGEVVGKAEVRWQPWPLGAIPANSIRRDARALADTLPFEPAPARFSLLEGEPLSPAKLARPQDGSVLALLLAPGMRAISVAIREETSVGGAMQPNDRVDVILTRKRHEASRETSRSEILLRGVKVLAIGKGAGGKSTPARTATLELAPAQARALSAAQSAGEISLALIGSGEAANGALSASSSSDPVAEIRILKYGRGSTRKTLQ